MLFRKGIVYTLLATLFTGIAILFWYNELVYSLPTPVPKNYVPVNFGNTVNVPAGFYVDKDKPVFLHFFNPDCPCSKFNMAHFRSLVKKYGGEINFSIVVLNNDKYSAKEIQDKFDLKIPVSFDKSIADACGVYSTPQAVITDKNHNLFYRGNYNRSRYCSDAKTNYAQQALESLLYNQQVLFNNFALKAYGCELPNCPKVLEK